MPWEILVMLMAFTSNSTSKLHPEYGDNPIIHHRFYSLSFDLEKKQAEWVAYSISENTAFGKVNRTDNFRDDDALPEVKLLGDYVNSGYDRGHLCPAGCMAFNDTAMNESFFMTNMSPQVPGFNRGIWKKLETQVRTWGYENKHIYVVTGPVLTQFIDTMGEIPVPKYYYKVILDIDTPEVKSIGFVLENTSSSLPISSFAVSIDSVEVLTGLNFFHEIPDSVEDILESSFDIPLWSWKPLQVKVDKKNTTATSYTCAGKTETGTSCLRTVTSENGYCWQHQKKNEPVVFVCGKSKIYHISSSHSSLKKCKSTLRQIPLSEAQSKGFRPCKE